MINSTDADKELRSFAFTLSCFLGFLGGLVLWQKGETGYLLWVIGMVILSLGLLKPRLLRPIHNGWMGMSFVMGFFMTHLILALLYYLVITPVALVMRALGKDPLRLRHDRNVVSYWIERPRREFTRQSYERMF